MEQHLAILMADLSGYTALTETHGSVAAADLIDRYVEIVQNCLVGDSKVHERTGDEIMMISSSPDFLLATAILIEKNTSNEHNFLQVHGGLHYGKVLKRADSYYGSAINLTARIASKARSGTFWCSGEFVDAISDRTAFNLTTRGHHLFKNISQEQEVFELHLDGKETLYIDPVCRMLILDPEKAIRHPTSTDQYFCSKECLEIFTKSL